MNVIITLIGLTLSFYTIGQNAPLKIADTVYTYNSYFTNNNYDTLLVSYDSLGREIETSIISQIEDHNNDSWYKYTSKYDSLHREISGMIFNLSGKKKDSPYYIKDTIIGKVDTAVITFRYNGDTIFQEWLYLRPWSDYHNKTSQSYEIKNNEDQTIEEAELDDIGGYSWRKQVFRDTINKTKTTVSRKYRKSGKLIYTQTDSLFCDHENKGLYLVKRSTSTRKPKRSINFECQNCVYWYNRDSLDRVNHIVVKTHNGKILFTESFVLNTLGKITLHKKEIPYGKTEEKIYEYDQHGSLKEYQFFKDKKLISHQIHNISYQSRNKTTTKK